MKPRLKIADPTALGADADLETVLSAWHDATLRLERTHETLRDEVHRLSDELAIKNRELARKNRLADLGQIASHVAHEVRNHLVPVSLYMSLLARRLSDDPDSLDVLAKVQEGFQALDSVVTDLLNFAADRDPRRTWFPVRRLTDDVLIGLAPQLDAQGIRRTCDVPEDLHIWADYDMLRSALLNLTLNALDAMCDGGELVITGIDSFGGVELEVADSGPGLSDQVKIRAFEPFFTTKGGGTGLGLAIVERIVAVHGGRVVAQNCPEGGAAFTLCLPHRPAMEAAA